VTPLRPYEWVLSLLSMSAIRVVLGLAPAALLAIPLYHYSIFAMGLPLAAFFGVLLMMGWALGLAICGLILRQGMGAEGLAWTVVFTLSPISCVYYPLSTLPHWLQHISWVLPSTYVFEGMRAVLFSGIVRVDYLVTALMLNVLYLVLGATAFFLSLRDARRRGALLQMGE
jgi:ABC-2 type transport system permease protein